MPVNSRDAQFGAAIGFIVIVGIVAIYFGFSTKLILALLAGLGILFCASLVEGYVRAAMLGTGALLLLLIAYDLATSCDSACQQTRAETAQQRVAQEQARAQLARTPVLQYCPMQKEALVIPATEDGVRINPNGQCNPDIWQNEVGCINVKVAGERKWRPEKLCKGEQNVRMPDDVEYVRSTGDILTGYVILSPPSRHQNAPAQ
jgi:hypothetical protein